MPRRESRCPMPRILQDVLTAVEIRFGVSQSLPLTGELLSLQQLNKWFVVLTLFSLTCYDPSSSRFLLCCEISSSVLIHEHVRTDVQHVDLWLPDLHSKIWNRSDLQLQLIHEKKSRLPLAITSRSIGPTSSSNVLSPLHMFSYKSSCALFPINIWTCPF